MISAIVLAPGSWGGDDLSTEREIVARSMVWLVSAVVHGIVRDVVLAVPAGLGLSDLADQSGCELAQAESEGERLAKAAALCREPRVLLLKAGYQPDTGLIEEIDLFVRREPPEAVAFMLGQPETLFQRLLPLRAPAVGLLLPRALVATAGGFGRLATAARSKGMPLRARARSMT